jgi:hypothetical protein
MSSIASPNWARGFAFRAICLTLCLSVSGLAAGEVTVKDLTATKETEYSVEDGSCRISWTAAHTKLNQSVIQQRTTCDLPLNQQLPLIERLLVRVLEDKETASNFKTLYLGGLKAYPEMRERLAILAKRSPEWDLARGRPKSGKIGPFVMRLANQQEFLAGWLDLFQRHGLGIEVSGVEKTDVSAAGKLSYFELLERQGIKATDRVPSNCLIDFSIYKAKE